MGGHRHHQQADGFWAHLALTHLNITNVLYKLIVLKGDFSLETRLSCHLSLAEEVKFITLQANVYR